MLIRIMFAAASILISIAIGISMDKRDMFSKEMRYAIVAAIARFLLIIQQAIVDQMFIG